jgi:prevent-host-death family protein
MHVWQIQEAKAKLTKCVRDAQKAPQIISRHGNPEAVVLNIDTYNALISSSQDVVSFFRNSPLFEGDLDLERDTSLGRDVKL